MNVLKPPKPSIPKPKSGLPQPPKSGKPPKPASPFSNPPLKPPFPANPFKPVSPVGGLPGALPNSFGKRAPGPLTRAVTKVVPVRQQIAQQVADFQQKQMADAKRVEAALKADARARRSNRLALS